MGVYFLIYNQEVIAILSLHTSNAGVGSAASNIRMSPLLDGWDPILLISIFNIPLLAFALLSFLDRHSSVSRGVHNAVPLPGGRIRSFRKNPHSSLSQLDRLQQMS